MGDKVPLALPGAVLPGGFEIKEGKLRGVESGGMMCSGKELGISDDQGGLLILPADSPVGAPLRALVPSDTLIEVEVTPNRPDLLSHAGLARELAALTGRALKPLAIPAVASAAADDLVTLQMPRRLPVLHGAPDHGRDRRAFPGLAASAAGVHRPAADQ